jgi:hypothetical protein
VGGQAYSGQRASGAGFAAGVETERTTQLLSYSRSGHVAAQPNSGRTFAHHTVDILELQAGVGTCSRDRFPPHVRLWPVGQITLRRLEDTGDRDGTRPAGRI